MTRLRGLHRVERPRERLRRSGAEALGDSELIAAILGTGYKGCGVLELADEVARRFPAGVRKADYGDLKKIKGIGDSRAALLAAAFEWGSRARTVDERPLLDSPRKVLDAVPPGVRDGRKEHFLAFYVNARSQLVHQEIVSIGTLSASLVHPREVFSPAIAHCAAAVIVAHNHPSGDCTPSIEDKEATRRLARAGELLGVPLLDHLIVSSTSSFSFKDHGLLS